MDKNNFLFIKTIIKNINIINGINIKIIDTTKKKNNLFDFFIICEGISYLHVKSIYNKIEISIYKKFNIKPYNTEGIQNYKWILIDYNFVIVNIFLNKIRYYYEIDNFWNKFPILYLDFFLKNKYNENKK